MKWETYKLLTAEQREEWKFKYSNIKVPNFEISILLIFWLLFLVACAIAIVILKEYITVNIIVVEFMSKISHFTSIILVVWIIGKVIELIYYIVMKYNENEWLKKVLQK